MQSPQSVVTNSTGASNAATGAPPASLSNLTEERLQELQCYIVDKLAVPFSSKVSPVARFAFPNDAYTYSVVVGDRRTGGRDYILFRVGSSIFVPLPELSSHYDKTDEIIQSYQESFFPQGPWRELSRSVYFLRVGSLPILGVAVDAYTASAISAALSLRERIRGSVVLDAGVNDNPTLSLIAGYSLNAASLMMVDKEDYLLPIAEKLFRAHAARFRGEVELPPFSCKHLDLEKWDELQELSLDLAKAQLPVTVMANIGPWYGSAHRSVISWAGSNHQVRTFISAGYQVDPTRSVADIHINAFSADRRSLEAFGFEVAECIPSVSGCAVMVACRDDGKGGYTQVGRRFELGGT